MISVSDKLLLRKRAIIETVNDGLTLYIFGKYNGNEW